MEKDLELLDEVHTFENQLKDLEINSENEANITIFEKYLKNILQKFTKSIEEMSKELEQEISKL